MPPTLLISAAKLSRQQPTPDMVHRTRLTERLTNGLVNPVTFISAPAGFGKSTLLADWLSASPIRSVWLSLDEDDSDLFVFAGYLAAAVQSIFPGALPSVSAMLNGGSASSQRLAAAFGNDIADLPETFALVLDDYHLIKDAAIHSLMAALVRRTPEPLRLVISARTDLPLPLAQLRASGKLTELRAHDLRFTLSEEREFFRLALNDALPEQTLNLLDERAEGWAVGLRFMTVALRQSREQHDLLNALLTQNEREWMRYLLDEVLENQSPQRKSFLLSTSSLGSFSAELCDAILDEAPPGRNQAVIDELVGDGMLTLVRGDEFGPWYRYHHLFGKFLRARNDNLGNKKRGGPTPTELQRRASDWCAEKGLTSHAIAFAIAAADYDRAANLVEENLEAALNEESARGLIERWLRQFPRDLLDRKLELVVAQLWLAGLRFQLAMLPDLCDRVEALFSQQPALNPTKRARCQGAVSYARAGIANFGNVAPAEVVSIAERVLPAIPATNQFARGNVYAFLAESRQAAGNSDGAVRLLHDALRGDVSASPQFALRLTTGKSD